MTDTVISIRARKYSYARGSEPVLQDLDLKIPAGSLALVLGPNGSGKSTLCKLMCGILPLKSATDSLQWEPKRAPVLIWQEDDLVENLTAGANVSLGVRIGYPQMSRRERQVEADRWLSLMGAESERSTLVASLSGGYRQRVALARALASKSAAIVFDEPTLGLDVHARRILIRLLAVELCERTRVIVSHDVGLLNELEPDLLYILENRRVKQVPDPARVRITPPSGFLALAFGFTNVFCGEVAQVQHVAHGAQIRVNLPFASAWGRLAAGIVPPRERDRVSYVIDPHLIRVRLAPPGATVQPRDLDTYARLQKKSARREWTELLFVAEVQGLSPTISVSVARDVASQLTVGHRYYLTWNPEDATITAE